MNTKDFAERYFKAEYEAFHEGKFDALEKLENPDVIYHQLSMGLEVKGFKAHKQQIMGMRQMAPGVRIEWKYVTGDGNVFAAMYSAGGARFTAQVPGAPPPTGKDIKANSLFVFRLNKGLLAEVWAMGSVSGLT